jgi:predicted nucleic acid-binding protein
LRRSKRLSNSSSTRLLLPDTNVLVYETVEDSPHHAEAASLIDSSERILLPSIVLHEYVWVMLRKLGVPADFLSEKIAEYLDSPKTLYIPEPPEVVSQALKLIASENISAREVNDVIIALTAKHYRATLATYDEKLRKLAERLGVDVKP